MEKKVFSESQIIMFVAFFGLALLILLPVSSKVFKIDNEKKYEQNIEVLIDASKKWVNDNGNDAKNYYVPIDYLVRYKYLESSSISGCIKVLYNDVTSEYTYSYVNSTCDVLINFNDLLLSTVTNTGDGLYKEVNKYVFKGKDPNNYIMINNVLYRLLSMDKNGIKIIVDKSISDKVFDNNRNNQSNKYCENSLLGCNVYMADGINVNNNSELFEYLENTYVVPNNAINTTWNLGFKSDISDSNEEGSINNTSKIGLITVDEYLLANKNGNWLNNQEDYWTSTGYKDNNYDVWFVSSSGNLKLTNASNLLGVRPVISINNNFKVSGNGTRLNPYIIK